MERTEIPQNVRRLIAQHIDSVLQVEILALLCRDRAREWTDHEVSRSLHIPANVCKEWLDTFAAAGLIQRNGSSGCRVASADADELIDFYSRRRLAVIDAIYHK